MHFLFYKLCFSVRRIPKMSSSTKRARSLRLNRNDKQKALLQPRNARGDTRRLYYPVTLRTLQQQMTKPPWSPAKLSPAASVSDSSFLRRQQMHSLRRNEGSHSFLEDGEKQRPGAKLCSRCWITAWRGFTPPCFGSAGVGNVAGFLSLRYGYNFRRC